ncbi:MAG: hypothetical protein ACREMY_03305 [bacterium]
MNPFYILIALPAVVVLLAVNEIVNVIRPKSAVSPEDADDIWPWRNRGDERY